MKKAGRKGRVGNLVLLAVTLLFLAGLMSVFKGCPPKEDGSFMTCHWAEVMLKGLSAVLFFLSLLHLLVREEGVKRGLEMSMIPITLLALVVPGHLIPLCMMKDMHCHLYMKPYTLVFGVLILMVLGLELILGLRGKGGK